MVFKIRTVFPSVRPSWKIPPRDGWTMWNVDVVSPYGHPKFRLTFPADGAGKPPDGRRPPARADLLDRIAHELVVGEAGENPWGRLKNGKRIAANARAVRASLGDELMFVDAVLAGGPAFGWDLMRNARGKLLLGVTREGRVDSVSVPYLDKHMRVLTELACARSVSDMESAISDVYKECLTVSGATAPDAYANFLDGAAVVADEDDSSWVTGAAKASAAA